MRERYSVFPHADDVAELENSLTTAQLTDTRQSTKAEERIPEPVGVAACLNPSDSASVAQDDYADSDPSEVLGRELDPACPVADEPIVGFKDQPAREFGESSFTD